MPSAPAGLAPPNGREVLRTVMLTILLIFAVLGAILGGAHSVRLQRSDLSGCDLAAGVFYALLAGAGGIAILAALCSGLQ